MRHVGFKTNLEEYEYTDHDLEQRTLTHFDSAAMAGEYTLCGLAWSDQPSFATTKKVDCPTCIKIVEEVKKIKKSEYEIQ